MKLRSKFKILNLSLILTSINALNILGIVPFGSNSHFAIGNSIIKTLHRSGHNVTIMSPYRQKEKLENFQEVDVSSVLEKFRKGKNDEFNQMFLKISENH